MPLLPIDQIPVEVCQRLDFVFTDIDDTLTTHGRLPAVAYQALWSAHEAGIAVVPVTGRPAGWCDLLARLWPVAAVVGENGALAFSVQGGVMRRIYAPRPADTAARLAEIQREVLAKVPGCKVAADQAYREYDLAIDFCEEVPALGQAAIETIAAIFRSHGATAKISSIHVNGYIGSFDKLSMCQRAATELLGRPLDSTRAVFVGDSPNDEPMFAFFPHAVGVANVKQFLPRLSHAPRYVTVAAGGEGFAEAIAVILERRAERAPPL